MKVLFAPKEFPHSKVIGGPIIIYNRIKHLAKRGHQVGLASFVRDEEKHLLESLEPYLFDVELMPFPPKRRMGRRISDFFFSEVPPYMCNTKSERMRETVAEMTCWNDYDAVITEYTVMGQYVHRNPGLNPRTKRIVSCYECYTIARKKVRDFYGIYTTKGFRAMMDLRKLEKYEFEMYREADKVLTLTEQEKRGLLEYDNSLDIAVVPHGTDIEFFTPVPEGKREKAVGFLGNYPHDPNRDAVMYFIDEMWPAVKKQVPGVKFYVIGRGPTDDILKAARQDPDIVVTGRVDDVRNFLGRLQVFVTPIRLGKGFRGKILEAMAMGIPVLSTRLGAEGIPTEDSTNIMLAEQPAEFINRTVLLLKDDRLRRKVGDNGRKLVEEKFSWQKGVEILEGIVQEVIS